MLQIPQWFANATRGGIHSGSASAATSRSTAPPALALPWPPSLRRTLRPTRTIPRCPTCPLLGYPYGAPDRAHRDTDYTSYYDGGTYPTTPGLWNPANGTGYWTWSDTIFDGGVWIDTPQMQGVLFIAKVGQGNVYYQSSDRHAQSGQFEWMVYNPADLAAVASGAKQQWQIQPEYEWTTPTLPFGPFDQANGNGYTGDGMSSVGGVVFDPTTNRLYVLEEGAISNGYRGLAGDVRLSSRPASVIDNPGQPVCCQRQSGRLLGNWCRLGQSDGRLLWRADPDQQCGSRRGHRYLADHRPGIRMVHPGGQLERRPQ